MALKLLVLPFCLLLLALFVAGTVARGHYDHGTCIIRSLRGKRDVRDSLMNNDAEVSKQEYPSYTSHHAQYKTRTHTLRIQVLQRCGHLLCNSYNAKIYVYTSRGRKLCHSSTRHSKTYKTVSCSMHGYPVKVVVLWPRYKKRAEIYRLYKETTIRIIMPKTRIQKMLYAHLPYCQTKKPYGTSYKNILITAAVQGKICPTERIRFPVGSVQSFKTRTLDGRLNNKKKIFQGAAGERLLQLAGNAYVDNISIPSGSCTDNQRKKKTCPFPKENDGTGSNRPNPRVISNYLMAQHKPINSRRGINDLAAYFGQFIDHDLDLSNELPRNFSTANPIDLFLNISVPKGDVIFDADCKGNQSIPLRRFLFDKCTGNANCKCPRRHINSISSVLDANNVYGSNEKRSTTLRTLKDGLMKTDKGHLPLNTFGLPNANAIKRDATKLRIAGDKRANTAPTLLTFHTLFVREHNRLAKAYKRIHPKAIDEEIFQHARKIVIAEIQAITIREYVPSILGGTHRIPKYHGYSPKIDTSISNEFSTAAFRFGHTQINRKVFRYEKNGKISRFGHILLREGFFRPERVTNEGGIDPIIRGSIRHPTQEIDLKMVDELRNFMFPRLGHGFDLAAINIQRGRETGIPDFNTVRKKLGLGRLSSFNQITRNKRVASKLKYLYGHVNNLDLWIGGIAEDHERGSELGETFRNIFLNQILRVRDGDRFWYERILTRKEINYVHQHSLGKIIELNTGVRHVPSSPCKIKQQRNSDVVVEHLHPMLYQLYALC